MQAKSWLYRLLAIIHSVHGDFTLLIMMNKIGVFMTLEWGTMSHWYTHNLVSLVNEENYNVYQSKNSFSFYCTSFLEERNCCFDKVMGDTF
jgi:hypothetical protein